MDPTPPIVWPRHVSGFDPAEQPVIQTPPLPELRPGSLQLPFIRQAFADEFPWQVEPLFPNHFDLDVSARPDIRPAAVFIPMIEREEGIHVLLTRRSAHLMSHAGQICFPGGRIEATDADFVDAALRETWEEVGIEPHYVEVLGSQPSFLTSSRYTMKPVVGVLRPGYRLVPDQSEVAEVFEVPLSTLLNPTLHKLHEIRPKDAPPRYFFSVTWRDYFIWGATAALIRNLYHFLAAAEHSSLAKPQGLADPETK
jgi:NTP pyrophosphohydrolases including oxidative damage repair enzymes